MFNTAHSPITIFDAILLASNIAWIRNIHILHIHT